MRVHAGDNWYPNLFGDRVRVSLHVNLQTLAARVAVWGADDTGVERETTFADGLDLYVRIARNTCPPRTSLLGRWGFRCA